MKKTRIIDRKLIESLRGQPCVVCGFGGEAHHLRSRKSGGDDIMSNLLVLCRVDHTTIHKVGLTTFCLNNPNVMEIVKNKGFFMTPSGHLKSKYK